MKTAHVDGNFIDEHNGSFHRSAGGHFLAGGPEVCEVDEIKKAGCDRHRVSLSPFRLIKAALGSRKKIVLDHRLQTNTMFHPETATL